VGGALCALFAVRDGLPVLFVAAAAWLLYPLRIGAYYVVNTPRTSKTMPVFVGASSLLGAATLFAVPRMMPLDVSLPAIAGVLAGVFCSSSAVIYVYWYSRLTLKPTTLVVGSAFPDVVFSKAGTPVSIDAFLGKKTLWMFFRGNWCPLCMAQIREVAAGYQELARRGVEVVLVSPQSDDDTASLAKKFNVSMTFLADPGAASIRKLGILHEGGLPTGLQALGYDSDLVMPTVALVDERGVVRALDRTDNYRVRPEPSTFLAWVDALPPASAPAPG
jgi:peroxiredoxin